MKIYTQNDYEDNKLFPQPQDGFWEKEEFQTQLDYFSQRVALSRDFNLFRLGERADCVELIGTKYNFYVHYFMFGFKKSFGRQCTTIYIPLEFILEDTDVADDIKTRLLFHLDFFA